MTDLRKAAEEVLEAWNWDISEPRNKMLRERMDALRQALALEKFSEVNQDLEEAIKRGTKAWAGVDSTKWVDELRGEPEQEPVGYVTDSGMSAVIIGGLNLDDDTPVYTAPPKREWVGLTDEEVFLISEYPECCQVSIRNAEAKLKEKNGG